MRIGFDIDGVLANFSAMSIAMIRKMYRPDLPADYVETADWDYGDILQPGQFKEVFKALLEMEQFWTLLPAFEEAVAALREYIKSHPEDEIFYLTNRPDAAGGSAMSMTQLWLMDHGLSFENLIIVKSSKEKEGLLREHGIELYIDDLPSTIEQCWGAGLNAFLLDRPYNQAALTLPRVYSVAEFLMTAELKAQNI